MVLSHVVTTARAVLFDLGRFLALCFRSRAALAAENLFLRKQLALFEERKAHPQRATDAVVRECPLWPGCSSGATHSAWSSPKLSSGGIGQDFACSGGGSPDHGVVPNHGG
jgi:hypothetical protein